MMVNMSVKFDEEEHNILVSIVFMRRFRKNFPTRKIPDIQYIHCDIDLWPLTSKINGVYPFTMVNISAKFVEKAHNGLVFSMFSILFPYMSIVALTFDLQNE